MAVKTWPCPPPNVPSVYTSPTSESPAVVRALSQAEGHLLPMLCTAGPQ